MTYMKKIFVLALLLSSYSYAQDIDSKATSLKKEEMDEGDKQLLKRDTCRKPMEALESKYLNLSKTELEKMQQECSY